MGRNSHQFQLGASSARCLTGIQVLLEFDTFLSVVFYNSIKSTKNFKVTIGLVWLNYLTVRVINQFVRWFWYKTSADFLWLGFFQSVWRYCEILAKKNPKHKRNKNYTVGGCVSTCDADFVNLTFGSGVTLLLIWKIFVLKFTPFFPLIKFLLIFSISRSLTWYCSSRAWLV